MGLVSSASITLSDRDNIRIKGLLKALDEVGDSSHIRKFRGKSCAVDASCWLHRGAIGCCFDLVMGKPTVKYLDYCKRMIHMLSFFDIKMIIVFDGSSLPLKAEEHSRRRKTREDSTNLAKKYLKQGRTDEAYNMLKR
eukprot:1326085-Amorphochlora_amoeboformis.AAC.1